MPPAVPSFTLNNGLKMPAVGIGCWMGAVGGDDRAFKMVKTALELGYRHIDTADGYQNEEHVGKAIRESGVPRSEIFVTTKLPMTHTAENVSECFEKSLKKLDCEYVDLYLVHWPQATKDGKVLRPHESPTVIETWKAMEKLLDTGKVKSIGVSNFSIKILEELLPHASVVPVTNQVELHPCLPQNELKAYCESKGIILTAYSPFGQGLGSTFFEDQTIRKISDKLNTTPAQVVLSWGVQRGIAVVPKSENKDRMLANITLVHLAEEEMALINVFHKTPGMHRSLMMYHQGEPGVVIGWTYEEMGWNFQKGGIIA